MRDLNSFERTAVVLAFTLIGAHAVHWLMTSQAHPGASTVRTIAVGAQALFGFGGAIWASRKRRASSVR